MKLRETNEHLTGGEKEGRGARGVYCASQDQMEFNRETAVSTISVDEE